MPSSKRVLSRRPSDAPAGWVGARLIVLLAIVGAFAAAWYATWRYVRTRVLASEDFLITFEKVEITPPPEWIHSDIRVQVFRDASLDRPLSIADDDLVERLRGAFALHPWVAKVERVQKFHPARVEVQLVYRRPVCMVEVAGEWSPIDADGVVLPREDFSPVETARYPRLTGVDTLPPGIAGTRWNDIRVLGGAEIAAALVASWEKLGLSRIAARKPSGAGLVDAPTFDLVTRHGTTIPWGRAPGGDAPGEIPIPDKIARIERYLAEHGSLESQPGGVGLDLSWPEGSQPTGDAPLVPLPRRKVSP
jgi:hypothetical protein